MQLNIPHDCPECENSMFQVEDQGVVDTRDGESYGVVYYCHGCDLMIQVTSGVRNDEETLYDEDKDAYLKMINAGGDQS